LVADLATNRTGATVTKSDREIMEILESYDLSTFALLVVADGVCVGVRRGSVDEKEHQRDRPLSRKAAR